jgi:hypothetical protein
MAMAWSWCRGRVAGKASGPTPAPSQQRESAVRKAATDRLTRETSDDLGLVFNKVRWKYILLIVLL